MKSNGSIARALTSGGVLLMAALAFGACADGNKTDIDCETNPNDPACEDAQQKEHCEEHPEDPACDDAQQKEHCEEHPEDPACEDGQQKEHCEEHPEDPACEDGEQKEHCGEHPEDPVCEVGSDAYCEVHPDDEACEAACTIDQDEILALIDPQTVLADIEKADLAVENGTAGAKTLTFTLGRADANADPTSRLYLDLEAGAFLEINDEQALDNPDWDIAFDDSGFAFTNSGQSGKGRRQIMLFEGADFEEVTTPQQNGGGVWLNDLYFDKTTCEPNEINWGLLGTYPLEPAIGTWYDYEFSTHTTPVRDNVYVVYNGYGHNVYKIQFADYVASTGKVTLNFQYTTVTTPNDDCLLNATDPSCAFFCLAYDQAEAGDDEPKCAVDCPNMDDMIADARNPQSVLADIDAAALSAQSEADGSRVYTFKVGGGTEPQETSRLYLDLQHGAFVAITDEQAPNNAAWDIGFDNLGFVYANAGQNHDGWQGARQNAKFEGIAFEDVDTPSGGWFNDTYVNAPLCEYYATEFRGHTYPIKAAIGAWLDDDLQPKDEVYAIYSGSPNHNVYKIQFESYDAATQEVSLRFAYTTVSMPNADCLEDKNDASCQYFCSAYDQAEAGDDVSKCPVECPDLNDMIADGRNPQSVLADVDAADLVTQDNADGTRTYTLNVGLGSDPQETSRLYLDLQREELVAISDEQAPNNAAWDIGFDNLGFVYTNSGQNHDGWQGARQNAKYEGVPFEEVETPDGGWYNDSYVYEPLCTYYTTSFRGHDYPIKGAIGAWLDDDLQPKDEVYAIYSGSPAHNVYKIQFEDYDTTTGTVTIRFQYLFVNQPVVDCATVSDDLSCVAYCEDKNVTDNPECADYL